ncbi:MAG: hypothetical protein OEZ21_03520 [Candidatus Bathyarchaeota archaeon]|nr:hypothetical protein [Candidatus Bathyarchaeota archaeon]MDH5746010.1 hypothetical protein [Candidatus Bathyarchaeota archaeon]
MDLRLIIVLTEFISFLVGYYAMKAYKAFSIKELLLVGGVAKVQ